MSLLKPLDPETKNKLRSEMPNITEVIEYSSGQLAKIIKAKDSASPQGEKISPYEWVEIITYGLIKGPKAIQDIDKAYDEIFIGTDHEGYTDDKALYLAHIAKDAVNKVIEADSTPSELSRRIAILARSIAEEVVLTIKNIWLGMHLSVEKHEWDDDGPIPHSTEPQ